MLAELRGGWEGDTVAEFGQLGLLLQTMSQDVTKYRAILSRAKMDMVAAQALLDQTQQLTVRLSHMKANLPSHVPNADAPVVPLAPATEPHKEKHGTSNKENVRPSSQDKVSSLSFFSFLRHLAPPRPWKLPFMGVAKGQKPRFPCSVYGSVTFFCVCFYSSNMPFPA